MYSNLTFNPTMLFYFVKLVLLLLILVNTKNLHYNENILFLENINLFLLFLDILLFQVESKHDFIVSLFISSNVSVIF